MTDSTRLYSGPYHDVPDESMIVVSDRSLIPHFSSEEEEASYWDTHTLADHLWKKERGPRPGSAAEKLSIQRFKPRAIFNRQSDIVYVHLAWGRTAWTSALDEARTVMYDAQGKVIAIQFLDASSGIHLNGIPERERVQELVKHVEVPIGA